MMSTSSTPSPMILDTALAWGATQEGDVVMHDARPTRVRLVEGCQTPPHRSRPLKRAHSPAESLKPSSPALEGKKVKPLTRSAATQKRLRTDAEPAPRQSTPVPAPRPKSKAIPASPLIHRLCMTVMPETEPLGIELEKVFAVGVGNGLGRRVREGSRLGKVAELDLEDMEWE